jgi:hypothetical protein
MKNKPQPTDRDELVEVIRRAIKEYHEGIHLYPIGQEVEYVADALIAAGWRKSETIDGEHTPDCWDDYENHRDHYKCKCGCHKEP